MIAVYWADLLSNWLFCKGGKVGRFSAFEPVSQVLNLISVYATIQ